MRENKPIMFANKQKIIETVNAYHNAINANDIEKVEEYLDKEDSPPGLIDIEYINVSPIMYAAQEGYWDLTLKLFEREANLDVKTDPFNWYFIHECIVNAPDKVFKNVVKYADFAVKTKDGRNPLMVAIEKGKFERAQYLLDNGKAVIYDKDSKKRTALHYAALQNHQELFINLVQKGANIFEEDKDKKNPMDLLTDDIFRNSLPNLLEKMKIELVKPVENEEKSIEIKIKEEIKIEEVKTDKPKISSLSKLVKKK